MMARILLMTSSGRRHRWLAARLDAGRHQLVGILTEEKSVEAGPPPAPTTPDEVLVASHFDERDQAEARLLGDVAFPSVPRLELEHGQANGAQAFDWVTGRSPDLVILFGTSIIRPPLLAQFDGRMINLHLGLSPYYRGSATNFWPLVEGRPECVGATIHLAVRKVDAGGVLLQCRPRVLESTDRAHEIGTKALMAAGDLLGQAGARYLRGSWAPVRQDLSRGSVFRTRDFDAESVRRLHRRLDRGMVSTYLADQCSRDREFPIIDRR